MPALHVDSYGLPFAALWLLGVHAVGGFDLPSGNATFLAWVVLGAVSQIAATALLLKVMTERNFTLGVAYSKSEIIQVAFFGFVFLGDRISTTVAIAIALGTAGVLMLAPAMIAAILDNTRLKLKDGKRLAAERPLPGTLNHFSLRFELAPR